MAERSAFGTNMAGAHIPDSPSSREERYTARTTRANMDDIPKVESILGYLTNHTTTLGLTICDESGKQSFDTTSWVKGWHIALLKCLREALGYPQVMALPLTHLIDDLFAQVVQELGVDGNRTVGIQEAAAATNQRFRRRRSGTRVPIAALLRRTELNRLLHVPPNVQEACLARTGHRKYLQAQ